MPTRLIFIIRKIVMAQVGPDKYSETQSDDILATIIGSNVPVPRIGEKVSLGGKKYIVIDIIYEYKSQQNDIYLCVREAA